MTRCHSALLDVRLGCPRRNTTSRRASGHSYPLQSNECSRPRLPAAGATRSRQNSHLSTHSTLHTYDPTLPAIPASRNVSGASQFPTRADSTSATEITSRNDLVQPIARTPEGLPYPQLVERQVQALSPVSAASSHTALKGSPSSGSVKAITGGLLGTLGRRKGKYTMSSGSVDLGVAGRRGSSPSAARMSVVGSPLGEQPPMQAPPTRTSTSVPSPRGPRARTSIDTRRSVELR